MKRPTIAERSDARRAAMMAARDAWQAMPVGTLFWARYAWEVGFQERWHRTLWRREEAGVSSSWSSHVGSSSGIFWTGPRDPWTRDAGGNPTLHVRPIDEDTQARIGMLMVHQLYERLHVMLREIWVEEEKLLCRSD